MVITNPESYFGKSCVASAAGAPDSSAPSCSPQLQDIIEKFPFLAWLEDKLGQISLFSNQSSNLHWPLPEITLNTIRQALQTQACSSVISISDKRGHPITLNVSAYPLPYFESSHAPMRLVALCPVTKTLERDRIVISALIAMSLKNTISGSDHSRLTLQQRAIYQALSRGFRYKEIAAHLGISHLTVRVQITRMRKVLGPAFIPILRRSC